MTNTVPSSIKSHIKTTQPLEDKLQNFLINLSNNLSSRRQIFDGNVYICEYGLVAHVCVLSANLPSYFGQ